MPSQGTVAPPAPPNAGGVAIQRSSHGSMLNAKLPRNSVPSATATGLREPSAAYASPPNSAASAGNSSTPLT